MYVGTYYIRTNKLCIELYVYMIVCICLQSEIANQVDALKTENQLLRLVSINHVCSTYTVMCVCMYDFIIHSYSCIFILLYTYIYIGIYRIHR